MKKTSILILLLSTLLLTGCVNEEKMESRQVSIINKTLLEEKVNIEKTKIKMIDEDVYKVTFGDRDSKYYYFEYPVGRFFINSRYELNNYQVKD